MDGFLNFFCLSVTYTLSPFSVPVSPPSSVWLLFLPVICFPSPYTFPLSPFSSRSEWIYHLSSAPSKPVKRTERRSIFSGPDRGVYAVPAKCDSWKQQRERGRERYECNWFWPLRWDPGFPKGIITTGGHTVTLHLGKGMWGREEGWNIAGGDNDKMLFLIANCKNSLVLQTGVKVKTEERTTVVINDKLVTVLDPICGYWWTVKGRV